MTYPLSRILSTATAGYGVFALLKPDHLGTALEAPGEQMPAFDLMAYTYALRDIPVSAVGMFASSPRLVTGSMLMRIASDFGDATILGLNIADEQVRTKALKVTLGWGALNVLGLLLDRRLERRRIRRIV
ncbi:MAG: hypothetical protein WA892_14220 [Ornithinimicrobium sp.]